MRLFQSKKAGQCTTGGWKLQTLWNGLKSFKIIHSDEKVVRGFFTVDPKKTPVFFTVSMAPNEKTPVFTHCGKKPSM